MSTAMVPTKPYEQIVEYIPFGAKDPIKLSAGIIRTMVATPTKQGDLPGERDCIRFLMLCRAGALNPFAGDAFLIGYRDNQAGAVQWNLITSISAFYKRAEACPQYDGIESGVIVRDATNSIIDRVGDFTFTDDELLGGWAKVYRKDRKYPTERRVKLSSYSKPFGVWKNDAAGMICKVAEMHALRDTFPTMLGGLHTEPEMGPMPEITITPEPQATKTQRLTRRIQKELEPEPVIEPEPEPITQSEPDVSDTDAEPPNPTIPVADADQFEQAIAELAMDSGIGPEKAEAKIKKMRLDGTRANGKTGAAIREKYAQSIADGSFSWQ